MPLLRTWLYANYHNGSVLTLMAMMWCSGVRLSTYISVCVWKYSRPCLITRAGYSSLCISGTDVWASWVYR